MQGYVVTREGEKPDDKQAQPFSKAAAAFLKRAGSDSRVRLYDTVTGISYTPADADVVRLVYFSHLRPESVEIRSADGKVRKPAPDLHDSLRNLGTEKSGGLFVPADDFWLVPPPEMNSEFEQQIEWLRRESPEFKTEPPGADFNRREPVGMDGDTYPIETRDEMDLLPGLSGEKMLNATIAFAREANPATLAVLGALAGMFAYKSMGLKGVVGLLLAIAALKRYIRMGSRIIMDDRLDLVARGIQDGIPVGKDGQVDAEFLESLRHFPVGDHNVAFRRVNPSVKARQWEHNPIKIDPSAYDLDSGLETVNQVVDGDTLVGERGRYRLIGVDAPELDHHGHAQPGAQSAWDMLRQIIPPGTQVRVEVARNQPALYGRMPCYLYAKDPASSKEICVNQLLVQEGLARVTNFQPYHPKMQEFLESALDAISQRKGLWNALYNPRPQPKLFSVEAEKSNASSGNERVRFSLA
ncbi:MAG: hypothetical protein ABS95_01670 [Verrucomicrobia bacterium SCN 57-15]|nr:MAG: hypothetical protein ABS95_01670 [Verrucomicrobia bacterium SCN 57-15]